MRRRHLLRLQEGLAPLRPRGGRGIALCAASPGGGGGGGFGGGFGGFGGFGGGGVFLLLSFRWWTRHHVRRRTNISSLRPPQKTDLGKKKAHSSSIKKIF